MVFTRKTKRGVFGLKLRGETIQFTPLVLIVITAVILRIPSLFEPYWYGDEGIYLTLGEGLRQGLVWYRDIHDNKPPLLYLLAALSGSVFWFRLILLFWHAVTIVLFWKLAEKLFGKNGKAIILASGLFAILTTIPLLEGNIANAEIFMIGPIIGAMLILWTGKRTVKKVFSAGLLFSTAALFKVSAGFDMAAIVAFWGILSLWRPKDILRTAAYSAVLAAGFLVPILLTFDYYWIRGALPQYLTAAWFQNVSGYLGSWTIPAINLGGFSLQADLNLRALILVAALILLLLLKKRFDKATLFASVWLIFSLFASLLSGRPYPHYIIQAVPALSLLVATLSFTKAKYRFLPIPFLLIFVLSLVVYKFSYYSTFPYYANFLVFTAGQKSTEEYFRNFDARVPRTYKIAQFIASRTTLEDKIFIWGTEPEIYALSRRLPPGRYTTSYHIGDFAGEQETLAALKQERPRFIVVIEGEKREFPGFLDFLQANYVHLETISGGQIWKLVSPEILKVLSL